MIDISVEDDALSVVFCGKKCIVPFSDLMKQSSPVVVPQYFVEAI